MPQLVPSPVLAPSLRFRVRIEEGEWSSIAVRVGTYRMRARGSLRLDIHDSPDRDALRTARVELDRVADNSWVVFSFPSLHGTAGRQFLLVFHLEDPDPETKVSLYEGANARRLYARILQRLGIPFDRPSLSFVLNDPQLASPLLELEDDGSYAAWVNGRRFTPDDLLRLSKEAAALPTKPCFSLLVPVWNTPEPALRACIGSVLAQLYPHWELCLVDDASSEPQVREVLQGMLATDPRIKVLFRDRNGGISAASNDALAMATGDYVALLDHDDELAPEALLENARLVNRHPDADFIYSDEDKIDEHGVRFDPAFKPGWSPELLHSTMYTGHLTVYRADLVRRVGGFRPAFDGSQDFDLALRVSEEARSVHHIPSVLYHWRTVSGSAASAVGAKPYALGAQRRALEASLERKGLVGEVQPTAYPGNWRVVHRVAPEPLVSIVIPTAGRSRHIRGRRRSLLTNCLRAIFDKTLYENYEIVVVHNGDLDPHTLEYLSSLSRTRLLLYSAHPFNLSEKMNLGVDAARGDFVLLLNDDTEVISPDWLASMVGLGRLPGVGAVGAKLLFENATNQHVGVAWLDDGPNHVCLGMPGDTPGPILLNQLQHNCIAVTGACLLVRKELYLKVGGFDLALPLNYNDVDFCLRLRREGHRIAFDPFAQLYHYESASKTGTSYKELEFLVARWGSVADPYYNPNFRRDSPYFMLETWNRSGRRPAPDHQRFMMRRLQQRRGLYRGAPMTRLLSVLTPTYNPPLSYLEALAHSISNQTHSNLEWVIVDNGSGEETRRALQRVARDPRVKLVLSPNNLGIVAGTRRALEHAVGDYVFTVDHDDLLYLDALEVMAHFIERHPDCRLFYSDEDKWVDGRAEAPFFKPDWDPVYFNCCCYVAHLSGFERRAALDVGAYTDTEAEGCHDWDSFTRLIRAGFTPTHVPEVLYSWRVHRGSTASAETGAKPYTLVSQKHVLDQHLRLQGRSSTHAVIENPLYGHPGMWCVTSRRTSPRPLETVAFGEPCSDRTRQAVRRLTQVTDYPMLRVRAAERDLASVLEAAARSAIESGGVVAVVSDALAVTGAGWAWEVIGLLDYYPDAALLGGRILAPSGRVLWAGGHFGFSGFLGSPDEGRPASESGYHGNAFCQKSVDAVSPLFWAADAAFLLDTLPSAATGCGAAQLAAELAVRAARRERRVIYTPFLCAVLEVEGVRVRPAERPVQDIPDLRGRQYYHPLLSRSGRRPWSPD